MDQTHQPSWNVFLIYFLYVESVWMQHVLVFFDHTNGKAMLT